MSTELGFPFCDVLDGDGIKLIINELENDLIQMVKSTYETVDTGVDDRNLDLSGHGLILTLLCGKCAISTRKINHVINSSTYSRAQ